MQAVPYQPMLESRGAGALGALRHPAVAVALCGASVAAGVSVAVAGVAALFIPVLLAAAALVAIAPWRFALVLMVVGIVLEPNPPDFTAPLANLVWAFPQGVNPPLTISPFECLLLVTAASLMLRAAPAGRPGLPRVAWAIPAVLIFGMAWGIRAGAPDNLVYHEARGLIFGLVAFVIAWRMPPIERDTALRWLVLGSTGLATVILARYLFVVRPGYDAPLEFAFAHEDAVFLALAFVLGSLMFVRAEQLPARLFFVLHNVIVLAALFGSSRRAATLALIVGLATVAWVMLPRRPVLIIGLGVPIFLAGLVYVGAYWNTEYGAMAQPARAIRSQISPSERDASSDMYRTTEVYNIEQTIRLNRPLGIGFGMPFYQFQPLPDLTDFWPLQAYTPHQNLLWLWLKMGILGITVFLATWVIAFRRCLLRCQLAPPGEFPIVPLLVAAGLMMYLVYAKVDLALVSTRSAVGLAVLLAIAFRFLPPAAGPDEPEPATEQHE